MNTCFSFLHFGSSNCAPFFLSGFFWGVCGHIHSFTSLDAHLFVVVFKIKPGAHPILLTLFAVP